MYVSTAHLPTAHGSKYLGQLCKHFAHKIEVDFDDHSGRFQLQQGPAELSADDSGLSVKVTAEDARGIIGARFVIDSHLVIFAFREGFTGFSWTFAEA